MRPEDYRAPEGYRVFKQMKDGVVNYVLVRNTDQQTVTIVDDVSRLPVDLNTDQFQQGRDVRRQPILDAADDLPAVDPFIGGPILQEPP